MGRLWELKSPDYKRALVNIAMNLCMTLNVRKFLNS
jgi:hypothetical protein